MKYTKELLQEILSEGGATLLEEYEKYNQRMYIKYKCRCGKEGSKRFEMLNKHRYPYCIDCSKKIKAQTCETTCLKKYGVSNAAKTKDVINKIKEVFQENYGDHPKRLKETQEKWMKTCVEKYGGHPNQNKEVQEKTEKNSYRHKDYMLPSGNIVKIQGYEDIALNELIESYEEDDINIGRGKVPTISYICAEGKKRIYFPDFYIKSTNTILEIKSEWTLKLSTCRLEDKAKSVLENGYKYEVWVYNSNKKDKRILTFK